MSSLHRVPEIVQHDWMKRAPSIRIALMALWGMIFEEGPGKLDTKNAAITKIARALFQVTADASVLALKLNFTQTGITPKDILSQFWPRLKQSGKNAQLLLRYCDFLRVHTVADSSDLEITLAFFPSDAAGKAPSEIHTLWIEPISAQLLKEASGELTHPAPERLQPLREIADDSAGSPAHSSGIQVGELEKNIRIKDKMIQAGTLKLRELQALVTEKEESIKELKSGGVGTAPPLPPPDAESLLETFSDRYVEARKQIEEFEAEMKKISEGEASPASIETLKLKIQALSVRERSWIQKLTQILGDYRDAIKRSKTGTD